MKRIKRRRLIKIKNLKKLKKKTAIMGITAVLSIVTISVVTPTIVVNAESLTKDGIIKQLEERSYSKIEEINKLFNKNKDKSYEYKDKIEKIKAKFFMKMDKTEDISGIENYYRESMKEINEVLVEAKKVNKPIIEIANLESLKYSQKNDIVDVGQEKSEENLKESTDLNEKEREREQVTYTVKHLDFNTNKEIIPSQKMIGLVGEKVTENAISDYKKHFIPANYRVISQSTVTKTLKVNSDNNIVFYYIENNLKELKEKKIREIEKFVNKEYMDESKIQKSIEDINYATSTDQINKIFNEIQKDNTVKYIPTKLRVRYVNIETGEDLIPATTTIEWFGSLVKNIQPEKIEGFTPVKKSEEKFLKSKDINEVIFNYVKPNDNISLKDFMKKKINLKLPIAYENIDFTNNYKKLKEFAIKQIYQRSLYAEVITTKSDMEKLQYELIDMPIEAGYARYCRNIKYTQVKQIDNERYKFKISFTYNLGIFNVEKKDIEKSEEIIDKFVKQNINDSMSDYDKVKKIYDYIIELGSPYVNEKGQSIPFTENNRTVYSPATLLIEGKGVCDSYAMAFSRLAERSGLETKWVSSISTSLLNNKSYRDIFQGYINAYKTRRKVHGLNHAWNQVKIDGKWYNLDVYHGDYYDEHKSNRYYFFLKSDETFERGVAPRIWVKDLTNKVSKDYHFR